MTLQEYIEILEQHPKDKVLTVGLGNPSSWRGSYDELAFEPVEDITVGEMLDCARGCIRKTFEGYKGGSYVMDEYTTIHIEGEYGAYSDNTTLLGWFFELLLSQGGD